MDQYLDELDNEIFMLDELHMICSMPRMSFQKTDGYKSQLSKLNMREEI
jgi:hypothetical protein